MSEQSDGSGRTSWGPTKWFLCGVVALIAVAIAVAVNSCSRSEESPKASFDGDSRDLQHTQIVPTLDTPMERGKNVIWCASFQAAWKVLQEDIADGPVRVEGAEPVCTRLNAAPDPVPDMTEGSFYAMAGWVNQGVIRTIAEDLKTLFPHKRAPTFPDILEDGFLAYAYLEARVPFTIPYFQIDKPLIFTDSRGRKTDLKSFGLREQDRSAYWKLRGQVGILFARAADESGSESEFILDLCTDSRPNQIVLALVPPKASLAQTLAAVQDRIGPDESSRARHHIGGSHVLGVPDVHFNIEHHFAELERRRVLNPQFKGQPMDVAMQEVRFRLDRSGAELSSEAKTYPTSKDRFTGPWFFDRPFLLYMKKRGAARPFLVMWVDNAELLQQW